MRLLAAAAIAPIVLSLLLALADYGGASARAPWWSGSPLNDGPLGTSGFIDLLRSEGFRVVYGGPREAQSLASRGERPLYAIISPDEPLDPRVAGGLAKLVASGSLSGLLVADETGRVNGLLEALGGPRVRGPLEGLVEASCPWWSGPVSKPGWLEDLPRGWKVLCTLDGKPLAAEGHVNGVKVVVVADSSLFTNFMLAGLRPFKPTWEVALNLVKGASGESRVALIDTTVYEELREPEPQAILARVALKMLTALLTAPIATGTAASIIAVMAALALSALTPRPKQ